eukprot:8979767-Pyramimonas_sp.AAC.1
MRVGDLGPCWFFRPWIGALRRSGHPRGPPRRGALDEAHGARAEAGQTSRSGRGAREPRTTKC